MELTLNHCCLVRHSLAVTIKTLESPTPRKDALRRAHDAVGGIELPTRGLREALFEDEAWVALAPSSPAGRVDALARLVLERARTLYSIFTFILDNVEAPNLVPEIEAALGKDHGPASYAETLICQAPRQTVIIPPASPMTRRRKFE